jgi:ATP-binding cassette, subfamily B (MDR/TAP), member 10
LYQNALAKAAEIGAESISNSRVMKSFGGEDLECHRYFTNVDQSYEAGVKKSLAYGGFVGGVTVVGNFAIIIVIYYGAILVIRDEMSIGNLTSFVFYTIYIAMGLGMMSNLYTDFMSAVGASERSSHLSRITLLTSASSLCFCSLSPLLSFSSEYLKSSTLCP